MDNVERDVLTWINGFLKDSRIDKRYEALPKGSIQDPGEFPVARIISRALQVAGHRSPGPHEFDAGMVQYSYWRGNLKMVGTWPPSVRKFNQHYGAGKYPHLIS